jgi:hypothetical protein
MLVCNTCHTESPDETQVDKRCGKGAPPCRGILILGEPSFDNDLWIEIEAPPYKNKVCMSCKNQACPEGSLHCRGCSNIASIWGEKLPLPAEHEMARLSRPPTHGASVRSVHHRNGVVNSKTHPIAAANSPPSAATSSPPAPAPLPLAAPSFLYALRDFFD